MDENFNLGNNTEIEKALKEFEQKNSGQEKVNQLTASPLTETPKMIGWVIKHSGGIVKNEEQASYALLGFAALAIAVSLFLFFAGRGETKIEAPPGRNIIYPPDEPPRLERQF